MRCEQCGRPIRNAEMWELGGNPQAPAARSLRQLCWSCREAAVAAAASDASATSPTPIPTILVEAYAVVQAYEERRSA